MTFKIGHDSWNLGCHPESHKFLYLSHASYRRVLRAKARCSTVSVFPQPAMAAKVRERCIHTVCVCALWWNHELMLQHCNKRASQFHSEKRPVVSETTYRIKGGRSAYPLQYKGASETSAPMWTPSYLHLQRPHKPSEEPSAA